MVDILMATYNGERYIEEQINSILDQSFINWKLYIRDDGSKDNTVKIIKKYQNKYPDKIRFIEDDKGGLGVKNNFFELIEYSKSEYLMFCDQDDFWLKDKIQICINKVTNIENKYENEMPVLIYTDLTVVDKNLKIIDESFWKYVNINPDSNTLNYLMVENVVTGCTIMVNKSLVKLINNAPKGCLIHDWWIALVASVFGKIQKIDKPTILYRQHEYNEVGAKKNNIFKKLKNKNNKPLFDLELNQMEDFYRLYSDSMDKKNKKLIEEFLLLKQVSFIEKNKIILKNKIFFNSKLKNLKNILAFR